MRIVIGTLALVYPGGTESYCLTVARELERLGHDVILYADELGPLADHAAEEGLDVARELAELPAECGAVLANDAITAGLLAGRYPAARLVYCIHSTLFDVQLPPLGRGIVDVIVAPSERFAAHGRALALDVPVVRLTQPIDTEGFAPSQLPRSSPKRALLLSNYLEGRRREALVQTWTEAGLECVCVGGRGHVALDVRSDIAEADIVVAKARAALEGMACGKAVYVFDSFGGDGWVTGGNYAMLEADNFAGLATDHPVDRRGLAADLERYDPDMGWVNRELVVKHHGARSHVQKLIEVLRGPPPRRPDSASDHAATARTVRAAWRTQRRAHDAETRAAQASAEREAAETRAAQASAEREAAETRAAQASAERDAWRTRALDAEHRLDVARRLIGTRRVRAGLALGSWLDRARGR